MALESHWPLCMLESIAGSVHDTQVDATLFFFVSDRRVKSYIESHV
jgi:hypothetical protein